MTAADVSTTRVAMNHGSTPTDDDDELPAAAAITPVNISIIIIMIVQLHNAISQEIHLCWQGQECVHNTRQWDSGTDSGTGTLVVNVQSAASFA